MKAILVVAIVISIAELQPARAQSEIHLIPDGYVGWVVVAFRAVDGEVPVFEGDTRIYRIPKSGVLLTQAESNPGTPPAWKFFFEGADGTRTPIQLLRALPVRDTSENRADPAIGIFELGRGDAPGGAARCQVDFEFYFIGTKAQLLMQSPRSGIQRVGQVLATQYVCPYGS